MGSDGRDTSAQTLIATGGFVNPEYLYIFFLAVLALGLGNFGWRYFRAGSLTGAMLGGTIKRELGQVTIAGGAGLSNSLRVDTMESAEEGEFVALVLVSKAAFGGSMTPMKLSKIQARELVLQQQAAT